MTNRGSEQAAGASHRRQRQRVALLLLTSTACFTGAGNSDSASSIAGSTQGDSGTDGGVDGGAGPSASSDGSQGSDGTGTTTSGDTQTGGDACGASYQEDPDSLRAKRPSELDLVGTALAADLVLDPTQETYRAVAAREFDLVTPENALKWGELEPVRGAVDYTGADAIVDFACDNDQAVRGHALVYHQQAPTWLDDLSADELRVAVEDHIDDVVGRYAGRIRQWDVVNEAVADDGSLRDTVFVRQLGAGYIADAFRRAHQADPAAQLGYNDYGLEGPGAKLDAVSELVAGLVADGVPIHYVGFQGHFAARDVLAGWADEDNLRASIRRFADLGLEVYITEMDVRVADLDLDKSFAQREAYRTVVDACRLEPACKGVSFWGFFGPDDPLLFDESYARKPAYDGVLDGFAGAPGKLCETMPASAVVCDGAETTATWLPTTASGSIELSSEHYLGERSLRATVDGSGANRQALATQLFDRIDSGPLYMRAFVDVPMTTAQDGITIFGINEQTPPYGGVAFGLSNGAVQLSITTAGQYPTAGSFSAGGWHCVELEVMVGASGSATVRVDGVEILSASDIDTLPDGGYESANVGILYAGEGQQGDVLIDEVVVSTSPIGCP
jgi:endo-1,4-beta-xylanase